MTQAIEVNVTPVEPLAVVVQQSGIVPADAVTLLETFSPMFAEAHGLVAEAQRIVVSDATQCREMKLARELRLKLKAIRVNAEHARKKLKEDSLRRGNAIDGIAKVIRFLIEPAEQRLEEQEKFAERREAERIAAIEQSRREALAPYGVDTTGMKLGEMTEATFDLLLANARTAHERKLEEQRRAEAERIEAEARRREENERLRQENERLRKEREEAQEQARIEAQWAERDRKRLEEVERERREQLEKERARKAEEERKRIEAETAPDRQKLVELASRVRELIHAIPSLKTPSARRVAANVESRLMELSALIEDAAEKLV